jgi:hypothetical protein
MLRLVDFNNCERNLRYYGGESGAKIGMVYQGKNYLLKYPKSTKDFINPKISYTTSPISEFLGSQIYETFGVPVHETVLGYRDGKLVVACLDFLEENDRLVEFKEIKNTYLPETFDNGTTGSGTILSEVLTVIDREPLLRSLPGVIERFWDMFVIDAFIGNYDRNNGNWGVVTQCDNRIKGLAPVYDNGGAFYNKRDEATFEKRMSEPAMLEADAVNSVVCAYLTDDEHHIHPLQYIKETESCDVKDAIKRFSEKYDAVRIAEIINNLPIEQNGYEVIGKVQQQYYVELLRIRGYYICALA